MDEIKKTNEGIFNKIKQKMFPRNMGKGYLKKASQGGYYLNGNYVYSFGGDGSANPYMQDTWQMPEFKWLIDSKFEASYIRIVNSQIQFQGNWVEGEFKGANFWGSNSVFGEKGTFNGLSYDAPNPNFKATPKDFFNGKYTNNKDGILGKGIYTTIMDNVKGIELISVAVGWNVLLQGDRNKKVFFKVVKKLDENSTDFILQSVFDNKQIIIKWETIRSNYENNGFIRVGAPFVLMGTSYELDKVTSISVTNEEPNVPINLKVKNTIDFSTAKVDKKLKIPLKFQVSVGSPESIAKAKEIQQFINNGGFYDGINRLKHYIENGQVDGYADEKWTFLKPIFNNIKGNNTIVDDKMLKFMQELNDIVEIIALNSKILLKESKAYSVFADVLKKILNIDKFIGGNIKKIQSDAEKKKQQSTKAKKI